MKIVCSSIVKLGRKKVRCLIGNPYKEKKMINACRAIHKLIETRKSVKMLEQTEIKNDDRNEGANTIIMFRDNE